MKARILVAEDNVEIAAFMNDYLVMNGYEVELVSDGVELIRSAEARRPDLVITDVQMTGGYGSTAYLELQKREALKDVPVVFISAHPLENMIPQDPRVRFLQKPVDIKGLQKIIVELLPLGGYCP